MKALNIQQPWASLICMGIKNIENRSWKPKENPRRILIVASSKKVAKNFLDYVPDNQYMEILLAQDLGQLPYELSDLPTSAIVGYVDVVDFNDKADSCWGYTGEKNINWKLQNGHLFKTPITYPKGKLHLYDIPEIDESNLPETIEIPRLRLEGNTLHVPMSRDNMEFFHKQEHPKLPLLITDFVEKNLLTSDAKGNETIVEVKTVSLEGNDGDVITFEVRSSYFVNVLDEQGNPIDMTDWQGNHMLEQQVCFDSVKVEQ